MGRHVSYINRVVIALRYEVNFTNSERDANGDWSVRKIWVYEGVNAANWRIAMSGSPYQLNET
jgi:hypothetical protein